MFQNQAMAAGIPGQQAAALAGNVATGLVGAGSTNADAVALGAAINAFATAAAGTGAILPGSASVADCVEVYNGGANALLVYPPALGQINALTVTTGGFSIATLKSARFVRVDGVKWFSSLSA